ncbi:transcription factor E2F7 [Nelusetta ayraudi]|uniref:transcription factor E2F7 n=1 Tax=Nelusetta ayraudi TaxID=303726 RepID=UPI003F71819A
MEVEWLALKDLSSPRKSFRAGLDEGGVGHHEQKENIFGERRRSTPLKSPDPGATPMAFGRTDLVHVTPVKHSAASVEPLTPTANLKMLISAASPDIRDREMKKVLFRPIENEGAKPATPESPAEDAEADDSCQFEGAEEENDPDKKPSRKQKSLGLLCQKFLALYPDNPPPHSPIWISLDEVSTNLGVERRRIYDIINVLESLMMVGRIAKNSYTWFGRQRLEATLQELQQRGRQQGYHLQMEGAEAGAWREEDGAEGDGSNACANRKDKSLRIMSQKFVMLFLVSKTHTVTLDAAARTLIDESQDLSSHSKYKTKVRRLYDIANVLTSLNLIKKVHVREERGRKPAFKWLGPVDFKNSAGNTANRAQPVDVQDLRRAKMSRHASFNVTPTAAAAATAQRQVNSAPCSPRSKFPELQTQPLDYSRKTGGNGGSTATQQHFGISSDIFTVSRLSGVNVFIEFQGSLQACARVGSSLIVSGIFYLSFAKKMSDFHARCPRSPCSGHAAAASAQQLLPPLPASPHCLAYLPSLSQPSVVMLYRPGQVAEGPGSPAAECAEGRKRKRDESEDEERTKLRVSEGHGKLIAGTGSTDGGPCSGGEPAQYSHYLYVPNNAGLNSLNFLLSAGQQPAGLTLTPGSVPTLALPYVLLPPSTLSGYPMEARSQLSFGVPAVMPQAHVVVGGVPYALAAAADAGAASAPSPSSPERSGATGKLQLSPSGPRQTTSVSECMTPQTPKETVPSAASAPSASKPFFRTPAPAVGGAVAAARKRGSAQRRLDVGHTPAQPLTG